MSELKFPIEGFKYPTFNELAELMYADPTLKQELAQPRLVELMDFRQDIFWILNYALYGISFTGENTWGVDKTESFRSPREYIEKKIVLPYKEFMDSEVNTKKQNYGFRVEDDLTEAELNEFHKRAENIGARLDTLIKAVVNSKYDNSWEAKNFVNDAKVLFFALVPVPEKILANEHAAEIAVAQLNELLLNINKIENDKVRYNILSSCYTIIKDRSQKGYSELRWSERWRQILKMLVESPYANQTDFYNYFNYFDIIENKADMKAVAIACLKKHDKELREFIDDYNQKGGSTELLLEKANWDLIKKMFEKVDGGKEIIEKLNERYEIKNLHLLGGRGEKPERKMSDAEIIKEQSKMIAEMRAQIASLTSENQKLKEKEEKFKDYDTIKQTRDEQIEALEKATAKVAKLNAEKETVGNTVNDTFDYLNTAKLRTGPFGHMVVKDDVNALLAFVRKQLAEITNH